MAEGRDQAIWWHTASVMALIANVNRDPKKGRAMTPADFNPHATARDRRRGRRGIPLTAASISTLKTLMPANRK